MAAIEVRGLTMSWGEVRAVDDASFAFFGLTLTDAWPAAIRWETT